MKSLQKKNLLFNTQRNLEKDEFRSTEYNIKEKKPDFKKGNYNTAEPESRKVETDYLNEEDSLKWI